MQVNNGIATNRRMTLKKRFQIFVSSTFTDLRDERDEVANAIQAMGHIPAGMELFGSDANDSWAVIERTINLSDYFVLILAGRYGSINEAGISFTEKEYDYATANDIPILAFIHENTDDLPAGSVEMSKKAQRLLKAFRKKVTEKHQVTFWRDKSDLGINVLASLARTFETIPRPGWVRGDLEKEVSSLRTEKYALQNRLHRYEQEIRVKNAQLNANAGQERGEDTDTIAEIPVTLKWTSTGKDYLYDAAVDMPTLGAWLYTIQFRVHSAHTFAFAAFLAALSNQSSSQMHLRHPAFGHNANIRVSSVNHYFLKSETLSPTALAEIATAAMGKALLITNDPSPEAFSEYWKQMAYGSDSPHVFATINDTCWMNCARHYSNLPVEMRPELDSNLLGQWSNWATNNSK